MKKQGERKLLYNKREKNKKCRPRNPGTVKFIKNELKKEVGGEIPTE